MKKIVFLNKTKQLYYRLTPLVRAIDVFILVKEPTEVTSIINHKEEKFLRNVISSCLIKREDADLVEQIMKSNELAVQHMQNEVNQSVAELAQIKVSYGSVIKKWNDKWPVKI